MICNIWCWFIDSENLALIISIIALILSTLYNRVTYRLSKDISRKSVLPLLRELRFNNFENLTIKTELENVGIGPAIIKDRKFKFNEFENQQPIHVIFEIVRQFENDSQIKNGTLRINTIDFTKNLVINKGEIIVICEITNFPNKELFIKMAKTYMTRFIIDVTISYWDKLLTFNEGNAYFPFTVYSIKSTENSDDIEFL